MAILRRLLIASIFALLASASIHAQATIIDGSQTNLVIVGSGNSATGFVAWRSKFIPSHMIFAFELPAGFTAVNPVVRCSLDDQALTNVNPNDNSRWQQVAISALLSPVGGTAFDGAGPSVGTVGASQVVIVETGVFPCVDWAISPGSPTFNGSGNSKVTAVQLPASGDAAFLGTTGTILTSGGPRITAPGAVTPPSNTNVLDTMTAGLPDFLSGNNGVAGFRRADGGNLAAPLAVGEYFCIGHATAGPNNASCNYSVAKKCQNPSVLTAVSNTTTQFPGIVGGSNQTTKLCDVVLSNTSATAVTAGIIAGTTATCGTGTVTMLAAVTLTANTGAAPNFAYQFSYPQYSTFAGNLNFCLVVTGAGSVNATISFETD